MMKMASAQVAWKPFLFLLFHFNYHLINHHQSIFYFIVKNNSFQINPTIADSNILINRITTHKMNILLIQIGNNKKQRGNTNKANNNHLKKAYEPTTVTPVLDDLNFYRIGLFEKTSTHMLPGKTNT